MYPLAYTFMPGGSHVRYVTINSAAIVTLSYHLGII